MEVYLRQIIIVSAYYYIHVYTCTYMGDEILQEVLIDKFS